MDADLTTWEGAAPSSRDSYLLCRRDMPAHKGRRVPLPHMQAIAKLQQGLGRDLVQGPSEQLGLGL